jgi:hypothetical protein
VPPDTRPSGPTLAAPPAKPPSAHVERLFAWVSRYRRLGPVFGRKADPFATHIWVAKISIISGGSPPPKLSSAVGSGEVDLFTGTGPAHNGG